VDLPVRDKLRHLGSPALIEFDATSNSCKDLSRSRKRGERVLTRS
jgi:hypothetical protein